MKDKRQKIEKKKNRKWLKYEGSLTRAKKELAKIRARNFCYFSRKNFLLFPYGCTKMIIRVVKSGRKWNRMVAKWFGCMKTGTG